jgi:hypothetical protein
MARKTAKYYRESLSNVNVSEGIIPLLKEIIINFGESNRIMLDGEIGWNYQLKGLSLSNDGKLYVYLYWQGNDTDGYNYVSFYDVCVRGKVIIKAEYFFDGYRTRCIHGDIVITKEDVSKLVSKLSNYLSSSSIKERKLKADISKIVSVISHKLDDEYYTKYAYRFGRNEEYYNSKRAVNELIEKEKESFVKMDITDVLSIVDIVLKKNYKPNIYFGNSWSSNKKPYDITH